MARPLSDEKRNAILASAAEAVAALGIAAPTAKIASGAGVAEGTLFTYFATKDALFNALYLMLKSEVAAAMMTGYPSKGALRSRWRHLWDSYIDWATANPGKRKAIRQLSVSDRLDENSRQSGNQAFRDVFVLMGESIAAGAMTKQPPIFVKAVMESLAETTIEFILREPHEHERYRSAGFEAFWGGAFNA